jgi:hypothetical protein
MEECELRNGYFEFAKRNFAKNRYYDRTFVDDIDSIREPFEYLLKHEYEVLTEEWKTVSKNSLTSWGSKEINLRMYNGTCGTIYSLLKYQKYLRYKETLLIRNKANKLEKGEIDEKLDKACNDIK